MPKHFVDPILGRLLLSEWNMSELANFLLSEKNVVCDLCQNFKFAVFVSFCYLSEKVDLLTFVRMKIISFTGSCQNSFIYFLLSEIFKIGTEQLLKGDPC